MKIPYTELTPEILNALIKEFVLRDGTDYGEIEVSLQVKMEQVLNALKNGEASIYYDDDTETCTILPNHAVP